MIIEAQVPAFYYQSVLSSKRRWNGTDNYLEIIQNICRNYTDMKLTRDNFVNKTYYEPPPQSQQ